VEVCHLLGCYLGLILDDRCCVASKKSIDPTFAERGKPFFKKISLLLLLREISRCLFQKSFEIHKTVGKMKSFVCLVGRGKAQFVSEVHVCCSFRMSQSDYTGLEFRAEAS
jgi:hypothetical protein